MVAKKISAFTLIERTLECYDAYLDEDWDSESVRSILSETGLSLTDDSACEIALMIREFHFAEWAQNSPGSRSSHMREYRRIRKLVRERFKGVTVLSPEPSVGD